MVNSKAWLSLNGAATIVYLIFRTKCRIDKLPGKPGKRKRVILNNSEIVFTYIEAKSRYGISKSRFRRALKELVTKGFIEIADTGMGMTLSGVCRPLRINWQASNLRPSSSRKQSWHKLGLWIVMRNIGINRSSSILTTFNSICLLREILKIT